MAKECESCQIPVVPSTTASEHKFTALDHRRLYRKVDWRILPLLSLCYLMSIINRSSLGNAKLMGLEAGLNLTQDGYSWALSVFFFEPSLRSKLGYILFEVPSNLVMKAVQPAPWLAVLVIGWGILSTAMAANTGLESVLSIRVLIGVFQAGFLPGLLYYLTLWYDREQLITRLAICYSAAPWASAFNGILAYGINHMDGVKGLAAWRWLFLLEGIPTIILGLLLWLLYANGPATVTWLTPRERGYIQAQLAMDHVESNINETNCSNASAVEWNQVIDAFTDPFVYLHSLAEFGLVMPTYCLIFLSSTVIKGLGFTNLTAQLLVVPPNVLAAIAGIANAYHSHHTHEHGLHLAIPALLGCVGFALAGIVQNHTVQYIMIIVMTPGTIVGLTINVSWMVKNIKGKTKQAVTSAMILSFGNLGGVVAGQMYRDSEAPRYLASHLANAAVLLMAALIALGLKAVLVRKNQLYDKSAAPDKCFGCISTQMVYST
ncbi:hypothetical protein H4R34_002434 [Dimargaris verticillata]|uniref:Major facilitator superfamily (MFS) profile domain-containing protein n=1 Tax=Dimargaris verticillata TaxID=2761393 RepID=A0A9W8EDJ7_9FUNG|nr:hypothetical protein H4R34_002434 [Dimargaris verticillata]